MTPQARAQAAIELLEAIVAAARQGGAAADTLIARYFKDRRYAGAKDRRAVRELVYRAIRRAGETPPSGRAALVALADEDAALAALFDGGAHAPRPIDPFEDRAAAGILPDWLAERMRPSLDADQWPALLARAPLDLRVNRLKTTRDAVIGAIPGAIPTPHAPDGLRLPEGTQVEQLAAWRSGEVEVQDEGSQLAAAACGAGPGMMVVDLCAGAGGKTLALAAAMAGEGRLIACDVDRARLSRLWPRADRAGLGKAETRLLDPGREAEALADLDGQADLVVIDAPCSGTGTWRRNPEARWRLTPAMLDRLVATQARLLDIGAALTAPGGHLAYIVCSLLDDEAADQIQRFVARHPGWVAAPLGMPAGRARGAGMRLTPKDDGADGFFIARIRAP